MQKRTSMLQNITDDQRRFLQGESSESSAATIVLLPSSASDDPPASAGPDQSSPVPAENTRSAIRELPAEEPMQGVVGRNFRLTPYLAQTLALAAADRKRLRQYPYTQQDIVCEAISVWLKKKGYRPRNG